MSVAGPLSPRLLVVLLLLGGVLPGLVLAVLPGPATGRLGAAPAAAPDAVVVLRAWDRLRAEAYARGDPDALTALYAPGSRTGARDVAVLEAYAARGLVVRGMRSQLLAVREVARDDRRLVLAVRDRVRGAVAVGRGARVELPVARPQRRTVTLVRRGGEWRVSEAVASG